MRLKLNTKNTFLNEGRLETLKNVVPYFQPIICADKQEVWGFEVLGRVRSSSGVKSLGTFFHDETAYSSSQRQVDKHIRRAALAAFSKNKNANLFLFINIHPDWLSLDWQEGERDWVLEYGMDPKRIILEVTESMFFIKNRELMHMLDYYRNLGCKIAIDDVGKGFSNLDRVASFQPDILKVDINLIQNSTNSQAFRDILHSLSVLALKIGASLLFEGIEKMNEWMNAWKSGGRFYQGYLFGKPHSSLENSFVPVQKEIGEMIDQLIEQEFTSQKSQFELESSLNEKVTFLHSIMPKKPNSDAYVAQFLIYLPKSCYRVYLCDGKGYQKTVHFVRSEGTWAEQPEHKGKNWSWRPYFIYNLAKMKAEGKGILSEPYRDFETSLLICTFSYPVSQGYLFLDILIE